MKILAVLLIIIACKASFASDLKSDDMCQQYVNGLFTDVNLASNVGMQSLRVALNRIADSHPEYLEMATNIAFGNALDEKGHRRVGQHINYMCTQDGSKLNDLIYDVLLSETIKLIK